MLLGTLCLGYVIPRGDFWQLFAVFSGLFLGMILIKNLVLDSHLSWIFVGGLVIRLTLLLAIPAWSEDFVRFLWDGELLRMGANPYLLAPVDFQDFQNPYLAQLLELMNSPNYFSVYPPLNQGLFWIAASVGKMELLDSIIALRILLIVAEIGVFFTLKSLMKGFGKSEGLLILYWLNPLVILELSGNLHFEGLVLLMILGTIYFLWKGSKAVAGFLWGLAIGVKLLPVILFPSLFLHLQIKKSMVFWIGACLAFVLSFVWLLIDNSWVNFFQSLQLYQGKFEFNASVYYLLREVGFWIKGYNTIATLTKLLSGVTLVSILYFSWKRNPKTLPGLVDLWVLIYLIYLILQPVVHPWYIIPAFGLSLLTQKISVLAWTFSVIFSYQAYSNLNFQEQSFYLFIEYGILAGGIYLDYFLPKKKSILQDEI